MIHELAGDILLSHAQAIAHGVAPNDDFKNGLALGLRERWPAMYKDFRHYCHTMNPKPGDAWMWGGTGGTRIVSLLTQEGPSQEGAHPGRAQVSYVNQALRALHKIVEQERFNSLALPRLATGVGSLAWEDVLPLIRQHLGVLKLPIFIYSTYQPGVAAQEPSV